MINRVNMDGVKGYSDGAAGVPKGGYVCKIMGVTVKQNKVGQYLEVSCDIAEGEYSGVFTEDYRNQSGENKKWHCNAFVNVPLDNGTERDGWTKRSFQTFIDALEGSNPKYHFDWDETRMKGLLVGAIFGVREWEDRDGNIHESTSIARWTPADKIRSGKYRVPEDKRISDAAEPKNANGFTTVDDSDLPF